MHRPAITPLQRDTVVLAHGGGGSLMQALIAEHILPALGAAPAVASTDGAVVPMGGTNVVLTTDSYVVTPVVFPGGDIGRLAVAGTVNDLAVMGARPIALSLGLILEEGLSLALLERVLNSARQAAAEAGVEVVTGDTKVVERRAAVSGDEVPTASLMINTAGVGELGPGVQLGLQRVQPGDAVLVNGPIAEHGLAVMSAREGWEFDTDLRSDVAPLSGLIAALLDGGARVRFLRDATRGGLAGVLADVAAGSGYSVEIDEAALPVRPAARHAAELLGLDPLTVANEGKVVAVVAGEDAERALAALRSHAYGQDAVRIGVVVDRRPPLVELLTTAGGRRIVQRPYGEELPRIC